MPKTKPWYERTEEDRIKAVFESRREFGEKVPIEQNPSAFERNVDLAIFQNALNGLRKHFTPEEIRGVVEEHFQLETPTDTLKNFVREVQYPLKNYLEMKQADITDKQKDLLEEGLEAWGEEAQTAAKDSLEMGYLAADLFDDILEILEDRV